jgi:hypothetical protein
MIEPTKQSVRERLGDRSLLSVALDVHMVNVGSFDRGEDAQAEDRQLLRDAVACWEKSSKGSEAFDEAVLGLIHCALAESAWYEKEARF